MPTLPDLRPLIINLLGRYLIQWQLDGLGADSDTKGQRSHQTLSQLLEVLCSTVQPASQLSHTTLQFTRYVSLLERIQKLKEGDRDERTLTEVFELFSNLSKSPELSDPAINAKLSSLMATSMAGLSADTITDYSCQVLDFVRTAMEWYPVLPNISLSGDAFEARKDAAAIQKQESRRRRRKASVPVHMPGTKQEPTEHTPAPPPNLKIENRVADLAESSPEALKPLKDLKCKLGFESVVSALNSTVESGSGKVDSDNDSNLVAHNCSTLETMYNSESGNGILIYPPVQALGEKENETDMDDNVEIAARKKGIFDRGIESSVEMEWSSDESIPITSGKTTGIVGQTDSFNLVTLPTQSSFNRKGAWSEEESRCLLEGVEKFGEGKWKEIRAESYSILKYRTTSQLKDKYRNIKGRQKHY